MAGFGLGPGSSDGSSDGGNRGVPARPLPKPVGQEEIRDGLTVPMGEVMPDYKRGDDGYTSWGSEWGESHENVVPDEDEEENLFTRRKKKERNSDGEPVESGIKKAWAKIVRDNLGKLLALGCLLAAVILLVLVVVLSNQNHDSATPTPETKTSTSSPADTNTETSTEETQKPSGDSNHDWQKIDPPEVKDTYKARGMVEEREVYKDPNTQTVVYALKMSLVKEGDSSNALTTRFYTTKSGWDEAVVGNLYSVTYSGDDKGNLVIVSIDKYKAPAKNSGKEEKR
jgi:hypothetical protein